jgi:hypothetical protein
MKFILDTKDFSDCEFETLMSYAKEKEDLEEMIRILENDEETDETEIDIKMGKLHCIGYFCSEPLPKKIVLDLLKSFRKQYEKSMKDLEERTGLVRVVEE